MRVASIDESKNEEEEVAPRARFELATLRLTAECSTIELPGNGQVDFQFTTTCELVLVSFLSLGVQHRFQLGHFRRVMLPQQLRIVGSVSAPVANDLTAHPGIYQIRNPSSSKRVHSNAGLDEVQLFQHGVELVLPQV